jgi:ribulose-5-phosphate 4-epimerase/fuculose-1-phosphate aldolase
VPDTDTFLINAFGLNYNEICASNLVLIDIDGNKLSDDNWPINKAGYLIHSAIHGARENDLHCVMHSHEVNTQALAASNQEVIPLIQEGCQLFERVGYHDFEGIVLNPDEQNRLIQSLGKENHTLLLRNHGLITAGPSAAWAFIRHQVFIRNTEVQLKLMASNATINRIPDNVLRHTRQQFEGGDAQGGAKVRHPEWPAFWRLLDEIDPSWKN